MQDYSLPIFDEARKWIKVSREHKVEWSDIFLARKIEIGEFFGIESS